MNNQQRANNVKKWIKALRSGKFKQGHGQLKGSLGYCCLGVANKVLNIGLSDTCLSLGERGRRILGLNSSSGDYQSGTEASSLVVDNDTYREDFWEIANIIVKNKDTLFSPGVAKLLSGCRIVKKSRKKVSK
jgi:hypothetical protein